MKFSQLETRRGNRVKQRIGAVLNGALNKLKRVFGKQITITDASDSKLLGLKVFGKSTQNGTPTPESPVDIVSVENTVVNVDEQTLSIPYKLCGIPVTSGGNYTDENGQQWICDEVDFERGVYVQRIKKQTIQFSSTNVLSSGYRYGVHQTPLKVDEQYYACLATHAKTMPIDDSTFRIDGYCYENRTNIVFVGSVDDTDETIRNKYEGSTIIYALATPIETPLTAEQIAAYKTLHTNTPNTTIINNQNAWMEVDYLSV